MLSRVTAARFVPSVVAVCVVGLFFALSQPPTLSESDASALAARFRFEKVELQDISVLAHKSVRAVHPSLKNVAGMISFVGAAVAVGDLDGDGLPNDLVNVDTRTDRVTVMPTPGTGNRFKPFILDASPLPFETATTAPVGCLIGDFNEDGLPDILVYYWGRSPILFLRKDVGGSLARDQFVATELVTPAGLWHTGAVTQTDFDGDGHIDLVIGNYFPDDAPVLDPNGTGIVEMPDSLSRAFNGGKKRLFLWQRGTGGANPTTTYRLAENALPDEVLPQWTFGFAAVDLDGDMLPELYCVHDWSQDRLLHNRSKPGHPKFAILEGERTWTTPRSKVPGRDTFNGMGVDAGDMNGDGWPDLFVSNITAKWGLHESSFAFMSVGRVERMRDGIAPYHDESERLGLSRAGWTWEARLGDFDNDGVLEAMQATGFQKGSVNRWPELQEFALGNDRIYHHPLGWSGMGAGEDINSNDRNPFFVRAASGRYFDMAERIGIPAGMISRGIATTDVDGDGKLDFIVANQYGPSYFFRNMAPDPGRFLGLHLRLPVGAGSGPTAAEAGHPRSGTRSLAAIGAQAKVHLPDGRTLVGQADGGTGHSGKKSPDVHFGLGKISGDTSVRVDIRWRGTDGQIRSETLNLKPGWHTVTLCNSTPVEGGRP